MVPKQQDNNSIIYFLKALKKHGDDVEMSPSWFMSDDAPQFYSAWTHVFLSDDKSPAKLLYSWHLDRAWKGLLKTIANAEGQKSVYQQLKVVMQCKHKKVFTTSLQKLLLI